jgi:hypothetical protein
VPALKKVWPFVAVIGATAAALALTPVALSVFRATNKGMVRIGLSGGIVVALLVVGGAWLAAGRSVFTGEDNRISTSKTIATVWTMVVAGGLLGMVYAKLAGHPGALVTTGRSGVVGQYAVLFGGPLGAAIAAKGIVNQQVSNNPSAKSQAGSPSPGDLVNDDAGNTDLGDLQYVLFNLVALVYVVGSVYVTPLHGLPKIPDVLLGLTSVSAAGYVGKKAFTPQGLAAAKVVPDHGTPGTTFELQVTGLTPPSQTRASVWVVFDDHIGEIAQAPVSGGNATFSLGHGAPTFVPPRTKPVPVRVTTLDGTVIDAGQFTYQ